MLYCRLLIGSKTMSKYFIELYNWGNAVVKHNEIF